MQCFKYFAVLAILAATQLVAASSSNEVVLYSGESSDFYDDIYLRDTSHKLDNKIIDSLYEADAGRSDSYDGSKYINFVYKDSVGFAEFRVYWDAGATRFLLGQYKNLALAYQGLLPNQIAIVRFAYTFVMCGSPTVYMALDTLKPSTSWTIDTISLSVPDSATNTTTSTMEQCYYYEMQVLINDTGTTVTPTNEIGTFKLDNMVAFGSNSSIMYKAKTISGNKNSRFFIPRSSGMVTLAAYSMSGELIAKNLINVESGKQYSISKFVNVNSGISKSKIYCVKIKGAGIDRTVKVW
jgi:hypothetical protein